MKPTGDSLMAQMVKNCPQCERLYLIPGSGRSPEEGNDNPFQYSCLENSMDRGVWWAIVHGVAKITEQLIPPHMKII